MNVGILSMQNVQNMGSLLQSYSLMKILMKLGHNVCFISIEPRYDDNKLLDGYCETFLSETGRNKKVNAIKKLDRYFIYRIRNKQMRKKQFLIFDLFRRKYLYRNHVNSENENSFDFCIIGSDEVFNCLRKSSWGFTTQLFGNVSNARQVITYAASCGSTVAENIPKQVANSIHDAMKRLKAISVRDENTKSFVKIIGKRDSIVHLDPVLIGNFDREIASVTIDFKLPNKYCIVYSYDNRIHQREDINEMIKFCNNHGLTPICIGIPQFWIKDYIIADPFQCLKVFKGAEFVITDTFHGTIFSAMYSERFSVIVRGSNKNKLQDLIDRLELSEHQLNDISLSSLNKAYSSRLDKSSFNRKIENAYEQSISYLKENLISQGEQ